MVANNSSLDPYSQRGYVCVEKNRKTYYYAVADGSLYESPKPGEKWQKIGCLYILNDGKNARYQILAPDRKIAYVNDAKLAKNQNAGTGYLFEFTSETYSNMLVTWRGEIVFKYYNNPFTITNDDKAVIQKKDGTYSLIEVATDE